MREWLNEHWTLLAWLSGGSIALFIASLVLVPVYLIRVPANQFASDRPPSPWLAARPKWLRVILKVAKNLLAVVLILAGLAMLVLPGQGLLTLAMGVLLLDFPGRAHVRHWLISRRRILEPINWLRRKAHRSPLMLVAPVTR